MSLNSALKQLEQTSKMARTTAEVSAKRPKPIPVAPKTKPIQGPKTPVGWTPPAQPKEKPIYDPTRGPIISGPPQLEALAKKFLGSATLGLTDILPGQLQKQRTQQLESEAAKMPVASTVASIAGYIPTGIAATGAKVVKPLVETSTKVVGKQLLKTGIGTKAVEKLGYEGIKQATEGAIVGTGMTVAEDILRGKPKDIPKDVLVGAAFGVGADIGLNQLAKVAKPLLTKIRSGNALSQSEKALVARQANVPLEQVDTLIQRELGLSESTTAQDFMRQQEQVAKDIEAEKYVSQFEKSPKQIVDDYTQWRKQNFGGAYGRMSPEDSQAMRDLYKETTGIDLNEEISNSLRNFQNRATGVEPTTPLKPVRNIPTQQMTPTRIVKPLYDINITETQTNVTEQFNAPEQAIRETTETERIIKPLEPPKAPEVGESTAKFFKSAKASEQIPDTIKQKLAPLEEQFSLPTTSNEAREKAASDFLKANKDDALKLVKTGDKFTSSVEPFIADKLIKQLTNEGRHDDVIEIIESMSKKSRAAGQDVQAMSIWSKATPEGMQRWTLKELEKGKVDPAVAKETAKQVGEDMRLLQKETDPKELAKLVSSKIKNKQERNAVLALIGNESNIENIRALGVSKIQADALNKIAVGTGRKLSTYQAMAHLLNARTFIGNILGNVASIGLEGVSNIPANAFDTMISAATGKKTVSSGLPKWQQGMAQGLKQGKQSMAEILLGVNKVQKDKYDLLMGNAFDNVPVLREGEKLLSLSLNVPDEFFKGYVKANSLYDQVRARIGKEADKMSFDEILAKATPDEFQTAIDEAAYATFQNDSLPAQFLTKAKQTLNLIGIGKSSTTGMKEFGLGDLVIKYTKVPGNIIARGIEYSPAGAAKGLYYLTQIPNDPKLQRKAAQTLGRAFTGTSLMGLGYVLNKLGIMSADADDMGTRELALRRSEGVTGNKINVSALERYIKGEDTTAKEGDTYKDFTWLQPLSVALSVGANIAANDGKAVDVLNTSGKVLEEVLDLPTLFTIKSMLYESQKEGATAQDVLTVPLAEAVPGFVPSIVRQTAQTMDPVFRETKGKDITETTKLKILANIPGQSQKLEPKISPTGKELTRSGGVVSTMIDRAATSEYKPTGYTDKLKDINKASGETSHFPLPKAPNTIVVRKEKLPLTPQEKTVYMKTFGAFVDGQYKKTLAGIDTSKLSAGEAKKLVSILNKIQDEGKERAKQKIVEGRK